MFEQLLEQLAQGLDDRAIPYMVVGGQAVLLYGEPRLTRNIDVTLGAGPERLAEILDLAKSKSWKVLVDSPADFVERTMVLPCVEPESGIRLDFIFSHSLYEQEALRRVRRVRIGKAEVCFASVEDAVVHKVIAGRPRDIEDVRSLLLKNPGMDGSYIRHWLEEFDRSLDEKFVSKFEEVWRSAQSAKL